LNFLVPRKDLPLQILNAKVKFLPFAIGFDQVRLELKGTLVCSPELFSPNSLLLSDQVRVRCVHFRDVGVHVLAVLRRAPGQSLA
jgi:hypothetical protein